MAHKPVYTCTLLQWFRQMEKAEEHMASVEKTLLERGYRQVSADEWVAPPGVNK